MGDAFPALGPSGQPLAAKRVIMVAIFRPDSCHFLVVWLDRAGVR